MISGFKQNTFKLENHHIILQSGFLTKPANKHGTLPYPSPRQYLSDSTENKSAVAVMQKTVVR